MRVEITPRTDCGNVKACKDCPLKTGRVFVFSPLSETEPVLSQLSRAHGIGRYVKTEGDDYPLVRDTDKILAGRNTLLATCSANRWVKTKKCGN